MPTSRKDRLKTQLPRRFLNTKRRRLFMVISAVLINGTALGGVESPFPATLNLEALGSTEGFRIDGPEEFGQAGWSVGDAGDVNGDGLEDIIIGAPHTGFEAQFLAGSIYVLFGGYDDGAASIDLQELDGTNGFRLDGAGKYDFAGVSVSGAGDVNGDGLDDVIVGASKADPNGITYSGSSYVIFGQREPFDARIALSDLNGVNGFRLDGAGSNDRTGFSVSGAGDINGDGVHDLVIGAPDAGEVRSGSIYVVFGRRDGFETAIQLSELEGSEGFRLNGSSPQDYAGSSVSSAGDFNGDGIDDVLIGAPGASPVYARSGQCYVVFGRRGGFVPSQTLGELDVNAALRFDGFDPSDSTCRASSGAGDVNGDGFDDVLLGAPGASAYASGAGGGFIFFGRPDVPLNPINLGFLDGSDGFRMSGVGHRDLAGRTVSGAGDINGDGFDDVVIGSPYISLNGTNSGGSFVVFGKRGGFDRRMRLSELDGMNGFRLDGASISDQAGSAVSNAGDINQDGIDDLIIGARRIDPNGMNSGGAYVVYGRLKDAMFSSGFD